ncbi:MAG: hypothetical protein AAF415_05620 [Pseudomonadota bacterium]
MIARQLAATAAAIRARPVLARWLLAGPGAVALAVATVMAAPLWLPEGTAGIDHLVWPLVLAPLAWAIACFYPLLASDPARAAGIMGVLTGVQAVLIATGFF